MTHVIQASKYYCVLQPVEKPSIMKAKKEIFVFVIHFLVGVGYPPMLTPDSAEARSLAACLFADFPGSVLIMAVHLRW